MLLYAGYKECTVRLFAGMPVCYIYSQQGGRQWSRPMAGRTNMKVYEGDENGNLVFEGGAAECLEWADGYCGHC